ncbi:carbohydrate esterase family 1 protein [Xylogone sp. PMI_703]|nr:carbohydrate esterase family 1 protein [Xylogone sp. PMI_703]
MFCFVTLVTWAIALGFSSLANSASLQQVSNFGYNPTSISMYIYVPDQLATSPPVIVALHPCGGSAQEYYDLTQLPSYADEMGFILVYPQTTHYSNCWDCDSNATLTHSGGGDSNGIISMVNYTLQTYHGDSSRVFSVGSSSGAMITSVLAATYPEVFAGCAGFSGVPAGCWAGSPESTPFSPDTSCPMGLKNYTAQQWGDIARSEYPGYNGPRRKMQVWEGTADTLVVIKNLWDQLAQWSNVFDLTFSYNSTNDPQAGYTKIIYGDGTKLVGYSAQGVGHFVPFHEVQVLEFFGLLSAAATKTTTITSATRTTSPPATITSAPLGSSTATQSKYGQRGGSYYTGPTKCTAGTSCSTTNPYYAQCL